MKITSQDLLKLNRNLAPERAATFAAVLSQAFPEGGIDKAVRVRHFFAQVLQETGGLRGLIESTNYKDPVRLDKLFKNVQGVEHAKRLVKQGPIAIANTIYAHKNGNGSVGSGDGFRYRGRGFLQVTGRANYRTLGKLIDMPLEEQPDLLGEPEPAALASVKYWSKRLINTPADTNDISTVTFLVNGPARLHLAERKVWLDKTAGVWT